MPSKRSELGAFALLFAAAALGFVLMGAPGLAPAQAEAVAEAAPPGAAAPAAARPVGSVTLPSFADLAERVLPAVASIDATRIERGGEGSPQNPFEFFFRDPRERRERDGGGRERERRSDSGGSGFVVSADGLVVTNHHVIDGATRVKVHLDGRDYDAEVKGVDPATDLAVLKIRTEKPLSYLPLGDSDRLRVGDWIMVVGNPLLLDQTVTVGVVSAKGRSIGISNDASFENFIQTDAAINRGNSGGPLVNLAGEVVGIATAMNWGAENIGFAVPVSTLRAVLPQLRDRGKVSRGYLGVNLRDLDFETAQAFGLDRAEGALVADVNRDTPAEKAGIQHGDVVVEVDGRKIKANRELIEYVSGRAPGETVKLTLVRDGKRIERAVTLAERPGNGDSAREGSEEDRTPGIEWLGIGYRELTPSLRQNHGLRGDQRGLWIDDVAASSPLIEEGVRPGDVILEVNGSAVDDVAAFESAVRGLRSGAFVRLYLLRPDPRGDRPVRYFAVTRVP